MQALAQADLDDVHAVWSGLGYYRRARNLHAGAQYVQNELAGHFPRTSKELQQLPGPFCQLHNPRHVIAQLVLKTVDIEALTALT